MSKQIVGVGGVNSEDAARARVTEWFGHRKNFKIIRASQAHFGYQVEFEYEEEPKKERKHWLHK